MQQKGTSTKLVRPDDRVSRSSTCVNTLDRPRQPFMDWNIRSRRATVIQVVPQAGMVQRVHPRIPRRHDHPPLNALGQLLEQEELKREGVLSERDEARAEV